MAQRQGWRWIVPRRGLGPVGPQCNVSCSLPWADPPVLMYLNLHQQYSWHKLTHSGCRGDPWAWGQISTYPSETVNIPLQYSHALAPLHCHMGIYLGLGCPSISQLLSVSNCTAYILPPELLNYIFTLTNNSAHYW